jgi:cell volume regulation protein A
MEAMNLLLLAGGLLVFVSLLAGCSRPASACPSCWCSCRRHAGRRRRPGGIKFDSPMLAAWVGNASLAIILLEGGSAPAWSTFRIGFKPALLLASVGVAVTASIVGAVAMHLMKLDWRHGLLLGAIVGSTDAAAVFSLLRHVGVRLGERVSATLELESGLNDPMAVFMVLALIATIKHDAGPAPVALLLAKQAGFGAAVGLSGGWLVSWLLRKLPLTAEHGGLLSLLIVSGGLAAFALAGIAGGSGFLAVYLFGLRVRALAEDAAHSASSALDGFAWARRPRCSCCSACWSRRTTCCAACGRRLVSAATLMFVARPLAVWLCLAPLRFPFRHSLFVGWVGLRGAVPIVLALFPMIEQVPGSARFFDVAFAVVLARCCSRARHSHGPRSAWMSSSRPTRRARQTRRAGPPDARRRTAARRGVRLLPAADAADRRHHARRLARPHPRTRQRRRRRARLARRALSGVEHGRWPHRAGRRRARAEGAVACCATAGARLRVRSCSLACSTSARGAIGRSFGIPPLTRLGSRTSALPALRSVSIRSQGRRPAAERSVRSSVV